MLDLLLNFFTVNSTFGIKMGVTNKFGKKLDDIFAVNLEGAVVEN